MRRQRIGQHRGAASKAGKLRRIAAVCQEGEIGFERRRLGAEQVAQKPGIGKVLEVGLDDRGAGAEVGRIAASGKEAGVALNRRHIGRQRILIEQVCRRHEIGWRTATAQIAEVGGQQVLLGRADLAKLAGQVEIVEICVEHREIEAGVLIGEAAIGKQREILRDERGIGALELADLAVACEVLQVGIDQRRAGAFEAGAAERCGKLVGIGQQRRHIAARQLGQRRVGKVGIHAARRGHNVARSADTGKPFAERNRDAGLRFFGDRRAGRSHASGVRAGLSGIGQHTRGAPADGHCPALSGPVAARIRSGRHRHRAAHHVAGDLPAAHCQRTRAGNDGAGAARQVDDDIAAIYPGYGHAAAGDGYLFAVERKFGRPDDRDDRAGGKPDLDDRAIGHGLAGLGAAGAGEEDISRLSGGRNDRERSNAQEKCSAHVQLSP